VVAPTIEELREAAAGPQVTATLDGIEVTQAIQDVGGSIPLIAEKRTFVRAYLGLPSGTLSARGELRVARKANGPWTTVSSFGAADLDASRSGSTPAQLRSRRENLSFSLDFRLPDKFTRAGTLWFKLGRVRDASNGQAVQFTGMVAARTVTFVKSPRLRLRVINLRYAAGTPPVQYAATNNDLEHLESWLTRAYPVPEVAFSSITVPATFTAPFENVNSPTTADQANAQLTALKALDVAGGRDPGTHYYGMVADGGGFMRGRATTPIPVTPDPNAVASGPTGAFNSSPGFGWDTDGSYGDWYGGHEVAHTLGRFHPGFCNGNSSDDPTYPFANGQLSNADGAFTGLDVGDGDLGIAPAALPGTTWHDIMTYCDNQWLSSYTYAGIRDRLVAEEMLFPDPDDDDDDDVDDGSGERSGGEGTMNGTPIHVSAVVNLTRHSAQIAYVTPLPGPFPQLSAPVDDRLALRVHMPDGSTRREPVVFKPNVCQQPDDDETGLVDTVAVVDPAAVRLELLLDGDPIATFEPGKAPGVAENLRVERGAAAGPADSDALSTGGTVLTWEDSSSATATGGAGAAGTRYAVQASTDNGRTWTTLAVGTTDRSLQLDPEPFSDATQVRFRVLTTNGFAQTIATTSDIAVENL
jgi:hypothetical protein